MNLMLIKKFFNIITIFNKMMFIEVMKLCLKLIIIIKEILYAAEYSQVTAIINNICIDILLDFNF